MPPQDPENPQHQDKPLGEVELGDAELEVLVQLWEGGPQTVRAVMNRLHGMGRQLAYTTVLTVLTRLEQKDYVTSNRAGAAYVYEPAISRDRVARSRIRSVLASLFEGAAAPMVLQLMKNERFSSDELAQMRRLIDELDS